MGKWKISDARRRLNDVIERARREGPQLIIRHGKEVAVVLSVEDYRKLVGADLNFKAYLLSGPLVDEFEIDRPQDLGREIEL